MSTVTTNYGLVKPAGNDAADIDVINGNMDIVDALLAEQAANDAYQADTGAANAYVITLDPAPTAYKMGQTYKFKAVNANTGASTLNVNGLGAVAIKKNVTMDLASGDIVANQIVTVVYGGTCFQFVGVTTAERNTWNAKQAALGYTPVNKAGDTMTGVLTAQANTSYTTRQVRNVVLSTADASGGSNGDIWIKYTP